jgi:hypothetical protein
MLWLVGLGFWMGTAASAAPVAPSNPWTGLWQGPATWDFQKSHEDCPEAVVQLRQGAGVLDLKEIRFGCVTVPSRLGSLRFRIDEDGKLLLKNVEVGFIQDDQISLTLVFGSEIWRLSLERRGARDLRVEQRIQFILNPARGDMLYAGDLELDR